MCIEVLITMLINYIQVNIIERTDVYKKLTNIVLWTSHGVERTLNSCHGTIHFYMTNLMKVPDNTCKVCVPTIYIVIMC